MHRPILFGTLAILGAFAAGALSAEAQLMLRYTNVLPGQSLLLACTNTAGVPRPNVVMRSVPHTTEGGGTGVSVACPQ